MRSLLPWFVICLPALAGDLQRLQADRLAIERVYHSHRTGQKPGFEEALPHGTLAALVAQDLRKEAMLKKAYGVEITPVLLAAEVHRINSTSRAPEVLAEIKAALGNDSARFAEAMAKPLLVERLLRERFDNDDALHAPQRAQVEQARRQLLAAKVTGADAVQLTALLNRSHSNAVAQVTWELGPRPAGTNGPGAGELEIKRRFGPDARVLSSPPTEGRERKLYLEDLAPELQNVLRTQLRQAGDVSAVIEMNRGFLLYVAQEKTTTTLRVTELSVSKRRYEEWLDDGGTRQ